MTPLDLLTLGAMKLRRGDEELLTRRRNQLVLLAYLASRSPRPASRAELAALLWGDRGERRARASLRQALSQLRRELGDRIETTPDEVRLVEDALRWDVREMEDDLDAGRLEAAVARWRGEFLPGAEETGTRSLHSWVDGERARLKPRYCAALDRLIDTAGRSGDWESAVGWARRWVEADRFSEPGHIRLIEALRLAGRPDEADGIHAAYTARLRGELEMEPSAAFRLLGERTPAGSVPEAVPTPPSRRLLVPALVGRTRTFAELTATWESLRADGGGSPPESGAVVLIEGEEGAGKSRLCEEFLRWIGLSGRDALVLRARASAAGPERRWAAARRLLDGLGAAPGLSGAPDGALAAVSRLVPSIRERYPALPEPDEVEAPLDDALVRVVGDVATETPVVLFLDDLGAADASTRRLLARLASHPPPGVMLLLTLRTDDPAASSALDTFRGIRGARRIGLDPLALTDLESLLASTISVDADQRRDLARRLYDEAGGNPFYTIALTSALVDTDRPAPDPGDPWPVALPDERDPLPLPEDARGAVRRRLGELGSAAGEVLEAAAVLQRPIDPALLEHVAGLPADDFAHAVEELLARRLLREASTPTGGYELTPDLIGRAVYEGLAPPRRQALHGAAHRALSRSRPTDRESQARLRHHRARAGAPAPTSRRHRRAAVTAVCSAVAAGLVFFGFRVYDAPGALDSGAAPASLAVLSLEDLSTDTLDAYLAEGFTEEIASRLGMVEHLRVKRARAGDPFPEGVDPRDPVALGEVLGVGHLVEGSVRRAGTRLRISVRLTETESGFEVWSETYDAAGADILSVQDTVAAQIATRIAGRLVPDDLRVVERRVTDDPEAYDHFLRGNYHLARRTPESVGRAIDEYERAARLDPSFSSALARQAYGYALFLDWGWHFPGASAREILARGLLLTEDVLERDAASADAWMARGYLFVLRDPSRHEGAVEAFERSIALDPTNAEAHHQLGQTLMVLGRLDEAAAAYRHVLEIEPRRAMTYVPLAAIGVRQGRAEEAAQLSDSAVAADPSVPYAYVARGLRRLHRGDSEGARRDAQTALALDGTYTVPARSVLAAALAGSGDEAAARAELDASMQALADPARPSPTEMLFLGAALLALGDREAAIGLVERTRPRGAWVWFYLEDGHYDAVRDDPRVRRIVEEVRPRALD